MLQDSASHVYDLSDRRSTTTDAGGFRSVYSYDGAGNVTRIVNPDNYSVGLDYDANNQVIRATDAVGNSVARVLDLDGKPRAITDPNGNTTTYTYYDGARNGRLKSSTAPAIPVLGAGRVVEADYDAAGNVIRASVGNPARHTYTEYDELNRVKRVALATRSHCRRARAAS